MSGGRRHSGRSCLHYAPAGEVIHENLHPPRLSDPVPVSRFVLPAFPTPRRRRYSAVVVTGFGSETRLAPRPA